MEFLIGNVPILALGPLVLGMHITVWIVFVIAATVSTCHGHSGWHFPLLGSMEAHDYHHVSRQPEKKRRKRKKKKDQ